MQNDIINCYSLIKGLHIIQLTFATTYPFKQAMDLTEQQAIEATFTSISSMKRPYKQIQIFTKTGNSQFYSQCNSTQKTRNEPRRIISKKKREESDDSYSVKTQKKDRNVTSNLIHHLVKYTKAIKGPKQFVQKIIKNRQFKITYERFYEMLENLSSRLKTYVTIKLIKELWFGEVDERHQFCVIMRVLTRVFYMKNGFLSVYFSNKFNSASKKVHFKGLRMLLQMIMKNDIQQFHTTVLTY